MKLTRNFTKTETELRTEIEELRANEKAIIIEQVLIADKRVAEMRAEMMEEIRKLELQITVCYEKLGRKDQEIRKSLIQIEELREWELKYHKLREEMVIQIKQIHSEYSVKINDLTAEIERLKKELAKSVERFKKLEIEHAKCADIIASLKIKITQYKEEIEELKRRLQERVPSKKSSSSSSSSKESMRSRRSSEEILEIDHVVQTRTEQMQFDVTVEKKVEVKTTQQVVRGETSFSRQVTD